LAVNFRITDEVSLGQGSETQKYNDNIAAISALKTIERENRRTHPKNSASLRAMTAAAAVPAPSATQKAKLKPGGAARSKAAVKQASARARC